MFLSTNCSAALPTKSQKSSVRNTVKLSKMYGSISRCHSVHYAASYQRDSGPEIKFLNTISDVENPTITKPVLTVPTAGHRKSIAEIICPEIFPPKFQLESQIRARKVQEKVCQTKKFFQLYKLRGYLSFLENFLPKVDETCQKLSDFCNETEESLDTVTDEALDKVSTEAEQSLDELSQEISEFGDTKRELNLHLENLNAELGSIEGIMKNIFIFHYSQAEFSQLEEVVQNLYTPSSLGDPPNFDRCLEFIHGSLEEPRLKLVAFKALLKTMENCGKLAKFNAEIIRLAFNVKQFEQIAGVGDFSALWDLFPATVKLLMEEKLVAISSWTEQGTSKSYLETSVELEGLVRLSSTVRGDENLWILKPVSETAGHYFVIENKQNGNLLGLKREGPEYRQVHHRPLQQGYFNQHWLLMIDNNDRIIFKNRAHYDLVLTSNGQSNVQACLLLHEHLQYWCIDSDYEVESN